MAKMRSDNFITITGFMCNEMELCGNELLIYGIIRGFSQDGKSIYYGGRSYLSETLNISKPTVDKVLNSLLGLKYIIKVEPKTNGDSIGYYANLEKEKELAEVVKNLDRGSQDSLQGVVKNVDGGSQDSLHNNITIDIIENEKGNKVYGGKTCRFTPPTLQDVTDYCNERGNGIDPQHFIDYYETRGWYAGKNKMKNWKSAIRTWENNDKKKNTIVNPFDY